MSNIWDCAKCLSQLGNRAKVKAAALTFRFRLEIAVTEEENTHFLFRRGKHVNLNKKKAALFFLKGLRGGKICKGWASERVGLPL